jgi:hypothetical protein
MAGASLRTLTASSARAGCAKANIMKLSARSAKHLIGRTGRLSALNSRHSQELPEERDK